MSEHVSHISDGDFETDVLASNLPVLVDFWAEWCGPCRSLSPILEEVAEAMQGKVVISKMNIDDNPETPAKFGVMSIPTMILFKDGNVEATKVGLLTKSQLIAFLESHL